MSDDSILRDGTGVITGEGIEATVSVNGGEERPLNINVPPRLVKQIDRVTGVVKEAFVDRDDLPHIGQQMILGGLVFTCSQITETHKDGDDVFTVTWKL